MVTLFVVPPARELVPVFRHQPDNRRGIAATEFAVCLPVLMLLLLGSIESCSMIFLQQSLAVAAYEAGHTALQPDATTADATATANAVLADRRVSSGTLQVVPGSVEAVAEGTFFEIRVSAPTEANRVIPLSFFGNRTLTATAVFMKEI